MNKYISFLLLIGFLMIFDNLQGQDSLETTVELELLEGKENYLSPRGQRLSNSYQQTAALRDGALVVLLRSESKRLDQLEILSRSSEYSEAQRRGILKKIETIKKEKNLINEALVEGFQSYRFSTVFYTYDTSITHIQNGNKKGFFLDNNGLTDTTIQIETDSIFFCRYGLVSTSQEKDGLIITDYDNNKIKPPFPSVTVSGASGILLLLNLFTNDEVYAKRSIKKDIQKLELSLYNLLIED